MAPSSQILEPPQNPGRFTTEKSDEWDYSFGGECDTDNFAVKSDNKLFEGFGAPATAYIKRRKPRSELSGTPIAKPYDKDDENRDLIHVSCDASVDEKPYFQISISLPSDALQRLIEADWKTQTHYLLIDTGLFEKTIIYGIDPDGRDVIWQADKCNHAYLVGVSVIFTTVPPQKDCLEEKPLQNDVTVEKSHTTIDQLLIAVDRLTESNKNIRSSIIKAVWVLAAVMIITSFIR